MAADVSSSKVKVEEAVVVDLRTPDVNEADVSAPVEAPSTPEPEADDPPEPSEPEADDPPEPSEPEADDPPPPLVSHSSIDSSEPGQPAEKEPTAEKNITEMTKRELIAICKERNVAYKTSEARKTILKRLIDPTPA